MRIASARAESEAIGLPVARPQVPRLQRPDSFVVDPLVGAVFAEVGQALVQAIEQRRGGGMDRPVQLLVESQRREIRRDDVEIVPRADGVRRDNAVREDDGAFTAIQRGQRFGEGATNPLAHPALAFRIGFAEAGGDGPIGLVARSAGVAGWGWGAENWQIRPWGDRRGDRESHTGCAFGVFTAGLEEIDLPGAEIVVNGGPAFGEKLEVQLRISGDWPKEIDGETGGRFGFAVDQTRGVIRPDAEAQPCSA